jgi:heme-degrading monooxygenase HmoA
VTSARPFRVLLKMRIKPGSEQDFESTWLDIGSVITTHPANLGQWLLRSADEPGVFYIVSDWLDEARFREFEHSAAHVRHRERLHPFRDGGSMSTMHLLHHLEGIGVVV